MGMAQQHVHRFTSFYSRVMLELGHRWVAYHIFGMIFKSTLPADMKPTNQLVLSYSYCIMSHNRKRYDWLTILYNLCMMYPTYWSILDNTNMFIAFWKEFTKSKCTDAAKRHFVSLKNKTSNITQIDHIVQVFKSHCSGFQIYQQEEKQS